ncbi:cytochrome P450 [Bailinhaonella thermotolerans]|uniref:Cytochrome P450 n=1 Tax=Bailinhaonella thermotolerans TaxID=1070861 RepID=A0A3A4AZU2_9ACTN|nr:cytochrome P450 [Bailinhaonella thermotolerans]RJL35917.1 cytochrome P450 [Bailinhaonella thermotolerans]
MTTSEPPAFPFDQPDLLAAPPLLRRLHERGPITRVRTPTGDEAWLVTGYEEVRRLLADDRLGLSHPDPDRAPRMSESVFFGPTGNHDTDQADRARMRAVLMPYFSARRMRVLRVRVEAIARELLEDVAASRPPVDLHEALAVPLPLSVICELLGVPYEHRPEFRRWAHGIGDARDGAASQAALAELYAYILDLVRAKRADPGDDVLSGLITAEDGTLGDDFIAMLGTMLLFAGHDTTVSALDYTMLLMLTHPEQRRAVAEDPGLIPHAVEEILRASNTGAGGVLRYARQDLELGGVRVRAGELLLLNNGAANHDESVFPDSDTFDIGRRPASPHVTFGYGPHYCLGAVLARIELQAALAELVRCLPGARLAVPVERLRVRSDQLTGGLAELPVTW